MNLLPAIIFLVGCFLAFATGTSWGTFGILIPIVVAVFEKSDPQLMIISIAACMAGAVCGDHCSPISDTTIMASAGAQCDHVNHVTTQLPYVITVAAVSFVTYLLAAKPGPKNHPQICAGIQIPGSNKLSCKNTNHSPGRTAARTRKPCQNKQGAECMKNRPHHKIIDQKCRCRPFILFHIARYPAQNQLHTISLIKKSRPLTSFIFRLPQSGQIPPHTVA